MQTQSHYTLEEFADLLRLETQLGILDGKAILDALRAGRLPREIHDIRGALRLALARAEDGLDITTYSTDLSRENLLNDMGVKN